MKFLFYIEYHFKIFQQYAYGHTSYSCWNNNRPQMNFLSVKLNKYLKFWSVNLQKLAVKLLADLISSGFGQ